MLSEVHGDGHRVDRSGLVLVNEGYLIGFKAAFELVLGLGDVLLQLLDALEVGFDEGVRVRGGG